MSSNAFRPSSNHITWCVRHWLIAADGKRDAIATGIAAMKFCIIMCMCVFVSCQDFVFLRVCMTCLMKTNAMAFTPSTNEARLTTKKTATIKLAFHDSHRSTVELSCRIICIPFCFTNLHDNEIIRVLLLGKPADCSRMRISHGFSLSVCVYLFSRVWYNNAISTCASWRAPNTNTINYHQPWGTYEPRTICTLHHYHYASRAGATRKLHQRCDLGSLCVCARAHN